MLNLMGMIIDLKKKMVVIYSFSLYYVKSSKAKY
jgi:hypothetical protein